MTRPLIAVLLTVGLIACGDDPEEGVSIEPQLPDECIVESGFNSCVPIVFEGFAAQTGGWVTQVKSAPELPDAILAAIAKSGGAGSGFDLILVIDGTGSMMDELAAVKARLDEVLEAVVAHGGPASRVGVTQYRDKCVDEAWFTFLDLTSDFDLVRDSISGLIATGGGDIPESIYDALVETVKRATWENPARVMLLVGDSHPHQGDACSDATFADVIAAAKETGGVTLYPIVVALFDATR